jgi:PAS domain S-box
MINKVLNFNRDIYFFIFVIFILLIVIIYLIDYIIKVNKRQFKIEQSEDILKTIINSLPYIICYKDGKGKWIEANDALLKLYDSKISIIGKTDSELKTLLPNFRKEFETCKNTDEMVWSSKKATMVEESFHQPDGTVRTFDVVKVPIFYEDGRRKGLAVLGRDITERKRTEELQRQTEEKDKLLLELRHYNEIRTEFFANLSHELRTPLNLIMSSQQLIRMVNDKIEGENHDKLEKYISVIKQNSFRLIKIVNNLIDITKIDAGYLEPNLQNANIVEVVEDITLSINSFVEQKDLTLIFDTNVEEKIISCDPYIIERIMLNLLSNSVKFTPKGGKIEVNLIDKIDTIEISVKDNGIGIPIEKQESVFERFVQVDKSLSRNREGSGIGLSLVKSFVEMHGGNIKIDNGYTDGSNFIISIPVKVLQQHEVTKQGYLGHSEENKVQIINVEFSDIYS